MMAPLLEVVSKQTASLYSAKTTLDFVVLKKADSRTACPHGVSLQNIGREVCSTIHGALKRREPSYSRASRVDVALILLQQVRKFLGIAQCVVNGRLPGYTVASYRHEILGGDVGEMGIGPLQFQD